MKQGEDMKKIVLIGGEELAVNALRKAAEESGVQTVIVSAECADMKVSDVFEISADMRPSADEPEQGYMLMEGLTIEELTALLRKVKEAGEEYEGIKVMRTETNQHWPLSVLMSHTAAEHRTVQKARVLQQILKSTNRLNFSEIAETEGAVLKNAMVAAYFLLQSGEYTEESIDQASAELMEALKNARKNLS